MAKSFNLISLGYRGVGKTVFLAGSCATLLSTGQRNSESENLWFDCLDQNAQSNIEKLLGYITRTGQYPPPTLKVTDFSFALHQKRFGFKKTLCQFKWLDIPGETCDTTNRDFQTLLARSHGCCVFIDAEALVRDPAYSIILERLMVQIEAIAALAHQHHLKYPFALICTKCDLLKSGAIGLVQVEERLKPLTAKLDAVQAHYRQFYSSISIVSQNGKALLQPKGASTPVFWVVSELNKIHGFNQQPDLGNALEGLVKDKPIAELDTPSTGWSFSLSQSKGLLLATLAGCGGVAAIASLAFLPNFMGSKPSSPETLTPKQRLERYDAILKKEPTNVEALKQVARAHGDLGEQELAIQSFEKLVQQQPTDLEALDELAFLYGLTNRKQQQEELYDRILKIKPDNLIALTEKAGLRLEKGDRTSAINLFKQAENSARTPELKQKIRDIADQKLKGTTKSAPANP